MSVTLTAPGALWLLAVVPVVWLARRWGRTNFNPRQQVLQALVRSLLLAALAVALARPVISMGSSRLSIVYVVDTSYSVSSKSVADAAARIEALNRQLSPAHWRVVAFGGDVAVLDDTKALRDLANADPASTQASIVRRGDSDLEQALRQARAGCVPVMCRASFCSPTDTRRWAMRATRPSTSPRTASRCSSSRCCLGCSVIPGSIESSCPND
jgi:nucleotide-binding universal stress UspA family protein